MDEQREEVTGEREDAEALEAQPAFEDEKAAILALAESEAEVEEEKRRSRRSAEEKRRLFLAQHWPLPAALLLAIAFWFHLDNRLRVNIDSADCDIIRDVRRSARLIQLSNNALNLRIPSGYTISSVTDANTGQPVDRVRFHFSGPKSALRMVKGGLVFLSDVPEPKARANGPLARESRHRFTVKDVRTDDPEANKYLAGMTPAEIQVRLEASAHLEVSLNYLSVRPIYPDPASDWVHRVHLETIEFEPKTIQLTGQGDKIAALSDRKAIFDLDLRLLPKERELLLPRKQGAERARISFPLVLGKEFRDLKLAPSIVTATVEVTTPKWTSPTYTIDVEADWGSSTLKRSEFELDKKKISFQILCFSPELEDLLKRGKEAFVKRWFRCRVDLGRINPETDATNAELINLDPIFFYIGDLPLQIGKHFEIRETSPIMLKKK